MKQVLAVLVGVAVGLIAVSASADVDVNFYQISLGSGSGDPQGNPGVTGSAATYLNAFTNAYNGTLSSQTLFLPPEASIWGPGGQYGAELYILTLATNISAGALVGVTRALSYSWDDITYVPYGVTNTYYYPMQSYTQVSSLYANPYYTTIINTNAVNGTYNFTQFASLAVDWSPDGSADNPPPEIWDPDTGTVGFRFRQDILSLQIVTGDWVLTGEQTAVGGYEFGTGYTDGGGGVTTTNLGQLVRTSHVVPEPGSFMLVLLSVVGLAFIRRNQR